MNSFFQQLSSQFVAKSPDLVNATQTILQTPSAALPLSLPAITDVASIFTLLASFGALRDWLKLFLLGSVLETIRRFVGTIWYRIIDSFFLSVSFESDDDACE